MADFSRVNNCQNLWPCLGCKWFESSLFDGDAVRHCYRCEMDIDGHMTEYIPENLKEE